MSGSLSALVRVFVATPPADRAQRTIRLRFSTLLPWKSSIFCVSFSLCFFIFHIFIMFSGEITHAKENVLVSSFRLLQNMIIKNMRPSRIHNYGVQMIARGEKHRFFLMTNERTKLCYQRNCLYFFYDSTPRLKRDIMPNIIFRSLKA